MKIRNNIGQILFILLPFTLCFSERLSTFVLIGFVALVLMQESLAERFRRALREKWVYPFVLLYFFNALSLLWSADLGHGWLVVEKKSALLALPLAVAMDEGFNRRVLQYAMLSLIAGCGLGLLASLGHAVWLYFTLDETAVFFYHALSWVLDEFNAVYFSFYLLMAVVFLDHLSREKAFLLLERTGVLPALYAFFAAGIVLLSSRLFIFLLAGYGFLRLLQLGGSQIAGKRWRWGLSLGLLLFISGVLMLGFTRSRFQQLVDSRFDVLTQERFEYDAPFNGLTLRLLFLKFGWEALQEERALWAGLGVGDARRQMNATIRAYNLYHGNPQLGDKGYLDYNFHNQYMQSWVQAGLPALACLLCLLGYGWYAGLQMGWRHPLICFVAVITAFACIEGVLERQRGVVFIAFFLSSFFHLSSRS